MLKYLAKKNKNLLMEVENRVLVVIPQMIAVCQIRHPLHAVIGGIQFASIYFRLIVAFNETIILGGISP